MEQDAQTWSDILHVTGGKLELTKCSLHVLTFKFSSNGWPIPTSGGGTTSIKIQDAETNKEISIKMLTINQAHKTLGHFKAPGKQKRDKEATTPTTQTELLRKGPQLLQEQ